MKFIVLLAVALAAGAFSAQATTENAAAATNASPEAAMTALFGDPAVAKGKNFEIKRSALDQVVSSAKAQAAASNQQLPAYFEISMLDQLITIQVLLQTANAADQAEGKQEADVQYTNLLKKFVSQAAFEHQLQAVGITVDDLRAKATQEAVARVALKRELNIDITDEEAKDYYTQHPADFEQPELVHVRHILLMTIDPSTRPPTPLSTNAIAEKRKQIDNIRQQIVAGADFATLARQYSEDPGSKDNGGELPEFSRGQMVPEFESAAFALETNQVSDVITSQYGYHIIKLLDKTPAKKIDFTTADQEIKDGLTQQKIRKLAPPLIKQLRADQDVQILDPDLKSLEEQVDAQAAAETTGSDTNK